MKTELIFILDRSGSMHGLEQDTIDGFNGLNEKQKTESGEAIVSLLLFDDQQDLIIDRQPLENVKSLTDREYYVRARLHCPVRCHRRNSHTHQPASE